MRVATAQSVFGRLLRLPLKVIPGERPLRVIRGPLRGQRWIPASSVHGCWLGSFERYEQDLLVRLVQPGQVVFDLGANVGFYTLLAARLVGRTGRVIAFEPASRNIRYLKRHLDLNACTNVTVVEAAVGDTAGIAVFQPGASHAEGHLVTDAGVSADSYRVPVVTLDDLVASRELPLPHILKIDVEGAEYAALVGATDVLRRARPEILLSTHSIPQRQQCMDHLINLGYDVRPMVGDGPLGSELYCVPATPPPTSALR
jgi:FkbM family methyltransferase